MSAIRCSKCGCSYEPKSVHILGHEEGMWFLRAFCSACSSESFMAAIIEEKAGKELVVGLARPEMIINHDALTSDDVLDMHNFLKEYNGDVYQLLR